MVRNVLIPIDGSENSERAFNFYLDELRKADDHLLLIHVTPQPNLPSFSIGKPLSLPEKEWENQIKDIVAKSQKVMEHYEIICEQKKIQKTPHIANGKPGEAIVDCAKKNGANLIVMGSRGLNAVRRTIIGSVSDYVLHHIHVPVMIVPPPSS